MTAEEIIKKYIPNGIVNIKGKGDGKPQYRAEIAVIKKCMEEYASQSSSMRWVKASERLPDSDGWYIIRQARHGEVGCVHEMFLKLKKWYWTSNDNSICGDGFIIEWLEENIAASSKNDEVSQDDLWDRAISWVIDFGRGNKSDLRNELKQQFSIHKKQ